MDRRALRNVVAPIVGGGVVMVTGQLIAYTASWGWIVAVLGCLIVIGAIVRVALIDPRKRRED